MRLSRILLATALLAGAQALTSGCILFPKLEDRVVELATNGSVAAPFHATGVINSFSQSKSIDLKDSLDVAKLLDDAGIDVANVESIKLAAVSYRITQADPTSGRKIQHGHVSFQRSGGPAVDLASEFEANADAVTGELTPTLNAPGVAEVNGMLADLLAQLKGGPVANTAFTYALSGNSVPSDVNTDFVFEFRITVSIVGTVKTKVIN